MPRRNWMMRKCHSDTPRPAQVSPLHGEWTEIMLKHPFVQQVIQLFQPVCMCVISQIM